MRRVRPGLLRHDDKYELNDDDGYVITESVLQRLQYVKVISFGASDRLLLKLDNEDILKITCSAPWNRGDNPEFFDLFKKVWPTAETILGDAYAYQNQTWVDVHRYRQRIDGPLSEFRTLPGLLEEGFYLSDPNAPWNRQLGDMTPRDFNASTEETTLARAPDDDDDDDDVEEEENDDEKEEDEDEKIRNKVKKQRREKEIRYEEDIKRIIVKRKKYNGLTWKDMFGQPDAVDAVQLMVDGIKGNVDADVELHSAVLLHGPPGTGKDQLAMISASELGATLFLIPKGFGSHKPDIWKALFDMASSPEMSPAVLFFNECDGLFTESAVTALCNVDWESKFLILGATNHPKRIPSSIASRFGPSIAFTHFDDEMRKAIVKRMKVPSDFASDDADWDGLLRCLQDMDGRTIVQVCKLVAARVSRDCKRDDVERRNVTLKDFQAHVSKSPQVENSGLSEDFIRSARYEIQCHYEAHPNYAPCVNLRHLLFMFVPATLVTMGLSHEQLIKSRNQQLEHRDNGGRADNTRLPPEFMKNLLTVMERAFPETRGDFNPESSYPSDRVVEYLEFGPNQNVDMPMERQKQSRKNFTYLAPKSDTAKKWMDSTFPKDYLNAECSE